MFGLVCARQGFDKLSPNGGEGLRQIYNRML